MRNRLKIGGSVLCAILCGCLAFGAGLPTDISSTVKVEAGSYIWTNGWTMAWQLKSIGFRIPTAMTNTFAISQIRVHDEITPYTTVVSTNGFGDIETNNWNVASHSLTTLTNALFSITTTNAAANTWEAYDTDDGIPENWYWNYRDVFALSFTETNDIYVTFNFGP